MGPLQARRTGQIESSYTPSPLGSTTTSYDALGRPSVITNPNGASATYTYTADDQVSDIAYSDGSSAAYSYDPDGHLVSELGPNGTTTYAYDAQGREDSQTTPAGFASAVSYDPVGNISSYTDSGGTVTYGYDPANNLTSLAEPGGYCATNTGCTTFGYDNNDSLMADYLPNGVTESFAYDGESRQINQDVSLPQELSPLDRSYDYQNAGGNDTSLVQSVTDNAQSPPASSTYSYDGANRLVGANIAGTANYGPLAFTYGYDPDGNLTSASVNGSSATATYNGADELTSPWRPSMPRATRPHCPQPRPWPTTLAPRPSGRGQARATPTPSAMTGLPRAGSTPTKEPA